MKQGYVSLKHLRPIEKEHSMSFLFCVSQGSIIPAFFSWPPLRRRRRQRGSGGGGVWGRRGRGMVGRTERERGRGGEERQKPLKRLLPFFLFFPCMCIHLAGHVTCWLPLPVLLLLLERVSTEHAQSVQL